MKEGERMGDNTGTVLQERTAEMFVVHFSQASHAGRLKRRRRLIVGRLQRGCAISPCHTQGNFAVLLLTAPSSQRPFARVQLRIARGAKKKKKKG